MLQNVTDRYVFGKPLCDGPLCDKPLRFGVAIDRSDPRWLQPMEPYERMALARASKFKTRAEFARLVGEKEPAYSKFERDFRKGTNGSKMNADRARQFGEPLGIRWQWLMWQEGAPWAEAEPYTQIEQLKEVAEIADEGEAAALLAAWAAIRSRAGTGG